MSTPPPTPSALITRRRGLAIGIAAAAVAAVVLMFTTLGREGGGIGAGGRMWSRGGPGSGLMGWGPSQLAVTVAVTIGEAVVTGSPLPPGDVAVELVAVDGTQRGSDVAYAQAGRLWQVALEDELGERVSPEPGDSVVIRAQGDEATFLVPHLDLTFDREGGTVGGATWAGLPIRLELGAGDSRREESAVSGSDGRFAVTFRDGPPVKGRTPVTATVTTQAGHRLSVARPVPYIVASMHPGDINGSLGSSTTVTATLYGTSGSVLATGSALSDTDGRFTTWLRDPAGHIVRAARGHRLVVQDRVQAFELEVPGLTGRYDLEGNRLWGEGVPGQPISLVVWNPYFHDEYADPESRVDSSGRWSLDPGIPIHPASHFYVTQHLPTGDEIFYCEQIPALHLRAGSPALRIETLWDVEASLTVMRDGAAVARAGGRADSDGRLELLAVDEAGEPVPLQVGDVVEADLAGVPRRLPVGPFSATITPEGTLTGATDPGTAVTLVAEGPEQRVTADADGRFAFDVSELTVDGWAGPGKTIDVFAFSPGMDHYRAQFVGPSVEVRLHSDRIVARGQPGAPLEAHLLAAGGEVSPLPATTLDALGVAEIRAESPLATGSTVVIATGAVSTSLAVPRLTARLEPASATILGEGPPSGLISVEAFIGAGPVPERLHAFAEEDGTWRIGLLDRRRGQTRVDPRHVSRFDVRIRVDDNEVTLSIPGARALVPAYLPNTLNR